MGRLERDIMLDVEASRAIRQAEVGASKTMIERTQQRFDIKPERLAGDTAYGSGANLKWLVKEGYHSAHPGDRQVETRGRDLQSGGLTAVLYALLVGSPHGGQSDSLRSG